MATKWKSGAAYALLTVAFLLTLGWIQPEYGADPLTYAGQAFDFLQHEGLAQTRAVLEFGHLIWRPVAVAATALSPQWAIHFAGIGPQLVPLAWLIAIGALFALAGLLLVYRTARVLSGSVAAGAVVALLFLTTNPMLTYMRSGYPYLPGAAMQILTISVIVRPPAGCKRIWLQAFIIGCALAASVCFWAPYVVSVPGIVIFAFLWGQDGGSLRRDRVRLTAQTSVWIVCAAGLAFLLAVILNRFESVAQVEQWIRASSHQWAQTHRLVRLATGLPRSLIAIQEQSVALKRIYFHDPYAPVSWAHVLATVAWKPPLFALAMIALGWILARTADGRRLLIGILCCWIPLIVFSVVIFEPGSISRFLPGYALLFAGLGYAAKKISWKDPAIWTLGAFFAAMIAVNISTVTPAAADARSQNAVKRLDILHDVWKPGSLAVLLSYGDGVFKYLYVNQFGPLGGVPFHFLDAIEPGTLREYRFRQEFSAAAISTWGRGGDVWISKRLVAIRPRPQWDWVEGDIPGIGWKDISSYYREFQTDASIGGSDGFLRITNDKTNRLILQGKKSSAR
jgi:hypothetical protein